MYPMLMLHILEQNLLKIVYQFACGKKVPHNTTVFQRGLDAGGPKGFADRC